MRQNEEPCEQCQPDDNHKYYHPLYYMNGWKFGMAIIGLMIAIALSGFLFLFVVQNLNFLFTIDLGVMIFPGVIGTMILFAFLIAYLLVEALPALFGFMPVKRPNKRLDSRLGVLAQRRRW